MLGDCAYLPSHLLLFYYFFLLLLCILLAAFLIVSPPHFSQQGSLEIKNYVSSSILHGIVMICSTS